MKRKWINVLISAIILAQWVAYPVTAQTTSTTEVPKDGWIAFQGKENNIWLVHPDGSSITPITNDASTSIAYSNPKWSPDGNNLAFSRSIWDGINRTHEIQVIEISNFTPVRKITDTAGNFDWQTDSRHIIYDKPVKYQLDERGCDASLLNYDGLYEIDINTGETNRYLPPINNQPVLLPSISPDNTHVIFRPNQNQTMYGSGPFFVSPVKNGSAQPLTDSWSSCDWSNDGQTIACDTWRQACSKFENQPCPITLYSPTGDLLSTLPKTPDIYDVRPVWSPDNRYIAVTATDGFFAADGPCIGGSGPDASSGNVDVIDLSNSTRRQLTTGTFSDWSPDGKYALVLHKIENNGYSSLFGPKQIFVVNTVTGDSGPVIGEGFESAWQPAEILPPPPQITDLKIQPDKEMIEKGAIRIKWTLPPESVKEEIEYDIRYSQQEINEGNWADAHQIQGVPSLPDETGVSMLQVFDGQLILNKRWYFGLMYRYSNSRWSVISNTPSFIDSGFRPIVDGYSFDNWNNPSNQPPSDFDFTYEDAYKMFGDVVCSKQSDPALACDTYKQYVITWVNEVNQYTNVGHCTGMAVSSLILKNNPNELNRFGKNFTRLYDEAISRDNPEVRKFITYYHVAQFAKPIAGYKSDATFSQNWPYGERPSTVLDKVVSGLLNQDYVVANLHSQNESISNAVWHSVLPFAVMQDSNGQATIYLYDNNLHGSITPIYLNPDKQSWSYGNIKDASFQTNLITIPVSKFTGKLTFPHLRQIITGIIRFGSILIVDSQGNRLGTDQGKFYQEIPGATFSPITGNSDDIEPIYLLPEDDVYQIYLNGMEDQEAQEVSIAQILPDISIQIKDIVLDPQSKDTIRLGKKEDAIVYQSSKLQEPSLIITVDDKTISYKFTLTNVDVNPNDIVSLHIEPSTGALIFSNAQAEGGIYDLVINRIDENGEQTSTYSSITIDPGSTQLFDISSWDPVTPLHMWIDQTSDGTYDEEKQFTTEGELVTGWMGVSFSTWGGYGLMILGLILSVVGTIGIVKLRRHS